VPALNENKYPHLAAAASRVHHGDPRPAGSKRFPIGLEFAIDD
jgi:hypothetical protein